MRSSSTSEYHPAYNPVIMTGFFEIPWMGETVTMVVDDNGVTFLGWDEEAELAAQAMGFEPSDVGLLAQAIEKGKLDELLINSSVNGNAILVNTALDAGADVHAEDGAALRWAAGNGHARVAKILLAAGADVHADNDLPLQWAARYGHADVVELLLAAGADVHAVGDYALEIAGDHDDADVVKVLEEWIEEHG